MWLKILFDIGFIIRDFIWFYFIIRNFTRFSLDVGLIARALHVGLVTRTFKHAMILKIINPNMMMCYYSRIFIRKFVKIGRRFLWKLRPMP